MTDLTGADEPSGPRRSGGSAKTQLRVGRLVKAHGLKGALKLELYTDDPDGRFVPGASFTLQVPLTSPWHGKILTVREFRWMNSHPVVFFESVDDRTTAESLVKAILWVDQDVQESAGEDDAWYDHQLMDLTVLRNGAPVGKVVRVDHLPAQDLLVVDVGSGTEVLVPFVKAIVPEVDIAGGRVVVTPPAGLFEEIVDASSEPPTDTLDPTDAPAEGGSAAAAAEAP